MKLCATCQARFACDGTDGCRRCRKLAVARVVIAAYRLRGMDGLYDDMGRPAEAVPIRTVVVEGQAYDVVWDGAVR